MIVFVLAVISSALFVLCLLSLIFFVSDNDDEAAGAAVTGVLTFIAISIFLWAGTFIQDKRTEVIQTISPDKIVKTNKEVVIICNGDHVIEFSDAERYNQVNDSTKVDKIQHYNMYSHKNGISYNIHKENN